MRLSRQSCNGIKPNNTHIYIIGGSYVLPPIIVSILPCLLLLCQFCPSRNAKHCMCQRKALQLPTQSFASAHAKLCICSRKALHDIVSPILNEKREERLSISGTVVPQGNYCRLVLPDYNYLRQRRLISSRVLPLVSGTMRQTKRAARMQMAP